MTDQDTTPTADAETRAARLDCLRCGARIEFVGTREFRTGGSTGATHFFLGQWAELGEEKVVLALYLCPVCRNVEFRAPV